MQAKAVGWPELKALQHPCRIDGNVRIAFTNRFCNFWTDCIVTSAIVIEKVRGRFGKGIVELPPRTVGMFALNQAKERFLKHIVSNVVPARRTRNVLPQRSAKAPYNALKAVSSQADCAQSRRRGTRPA